MGQTMSFGLTQYDVDELIEISNGSFTQQEIEALYKRFRTLDRGRKGFITSEEFLSIPELSINPLAKRLSFFFESINFREFIAMLAPYSPKASREDKLRHVFQVFDVDGDGIISSEDMNHVLRQLSGTSLSDKDVKQLTEKVFHAAKAGQQGLTPADFTDAMEGIALDLHVDVPVDE